MENKKKKRFWNLLNTFVILGFAGFIGTATGLKLMEGRKISDEINNFEKVEVSPNYGEGLNSLTMRHVGNPDIYHRDLRENRFIKDNPLYDGKLYSDQRYIIRSNNTDRINSN